MVFDKIFLRAQVVLTTGSACQGLATLNLKDNVRTAPTSYIDSVLSVRCFLRVLRVVALCVQTGCHEKITATTNPPPKARSIDPLF